MSDPKSEYNEASEEQIESIDELINEIESGAVLNRHPASRFAFMKNNGESVLFIDGCDYAVSKSFAESLCENRNIETELIKEANEFEQNLLLDLYNSGSIYLE